MKGWTDTEQSCCVFYPTAQASAAICEHPKELKAPGVQSSPALVWSVHSSRLKEQRNSFHGGKSAAPCWYTKGCLVGNVPKDWCHLGCLDVSGTVRFRMSCRSFLQTLPLPFPSWSLPFALPRFHVENGDVNIRL